MNQSTIERLQPYIDEYCKAKKKYQDIELSPMTDKILKKVRQCIFKMDNAESKIMKIIFENESNNQIEK